MSFSILWSDRIIEILARCNVAIQFVIGPSYIVEAQDYAKAIDQRIQAKCGQ